MSSVPVSALSPGQQGELLCTYAALILHDDGAEITSDAITSLIKAAGCSCEAYLPALFSKMCKSQDVAAILQAGGGGGGGGASAGGAAGGGDAAAGGEEKKDEAPPEEEEEEMEFDLFD
eukprot:g9917.t1